ncbi:MAG: DEAD/DEAH box helicase, partial [Planctomycetota bacterium]
KSVKNGVDWMIATPGRLLDLIQQKHIDLGNVKYFVLDEADRMLDMGFLPELKKIIGRLPKQRQSLFFSATIPDEISEFAGTLLNDPVRVTVAAKQQKIDQIQQVIKKIDQPKKVSALIELLRQDDVGPTIVFTRTKRGADKIAKKLNDAKINSAAIHGDKTQNARERALKSFAKNRVSVLVATDVASRGIDIRGVTHVVNYDAPDDPETYIHRIGRTGRAGSDGIAITFCSPAEKSKIRAVEKLLGVDLLGEKPRKSRRKPKHSSARSKSRPGKSRSKSGKSRAFSSKSNARSGKSNADSNNSSANSGKSNAHSGKSKKVTGNRKGKAFFGRKRRKSKSSRQKAAVV